MTRLIYVANIRLPTEKAHGLQIMQNCEAFADNGVEVTLWAARRHNTPELRTVSDPWAHYGVKHNFAIHRLPSLDLQTWDGGRPGWWARSLFLLQEVTYLLSLLVWALLHRADVFYSRDPFLLLLLTLLKPRHALAYEAHTRPAGGVGRWVQRQVLRRVGTVIPVTRKLGEDLAELAGLNPAAFVVAHDGIRQERFAHAPTQGEARAALGWPAGAFIVGYIGRLQTMAVDKGVGTLIDALRPIDGVTLALVGGPDDLAEEFRQHWLTLGLPADHFINAGQVTPDRVPLYLAALDVCAMPFPWTEHFAYYASPMKLFEYMASRRAIVASDLPSTAEVVTHETSALLYPPGDAKALSAALLRLLDDPALQIGRAHV